MSFFNVKGVKGLVLVGQLLPGGVATRTDALCIAPSS